MRTYGSPTLTALQTRAGVVIRILVWVSALNRGTGAVETVGLWTGADDRDFTINAATRRYYGAGSVMDIPPITYQAGLSVRMQRLTLSPLSARVADLIRTYDARLAPIEVHRALYATDTGLLIEEPHRVLKGFIDEVALTTPEIGGEPKCDITIASSARQLTRTLSLKRSDATQKLRSADEFLKYADVSGNVDVWWGEKRGKAKGEKARRDQEAS